MSGDDVRDRLAELEATVERQQETIEHQRERIAELESTNGTDSTEVVGDGGDVKVVGETDADGGTGVLGRATGSGATYGLRGEASASTGYGLSTPDDALLEGTIETGATDFVVETNPDGTGSTRNVVLGHGDNGVENDPVGATIAGGGSGSGSNTVTDNYGTVGGGSANTAARFATVAGGNGNRARLKYSTVAGGSANKAIEQSGNVSEGPTVGGGLKNVAKGYYTTIGGGAQNDTRNFYTTVGGGINNEATGDNATVPGGAENVAGGVNSFAAGGYAKATDDGAIVFGDSTTTEIASTGSDQALFQMPVITEGRISARERSIANTGASVYQTKPQAVSPSGERLLFDSGAYDDRNAYDFANNEYVAPADGRYHVVLAARLDSAGTLGAVGVSVNGTAKAFGQDDPGGSVTTAYPNPAVQKVLDLSSGDKVQPTISHGGSSEIDTRTGEAVTYLTVEQIA